MPIKNYGMLKGKLVFGVPYFSSYKANPHYVLVLDTGDGKQATVVVNSMSTDGTEVGIHTDFSFDDSIIEQLRSAPSGFPESFPRIDYLRDFQLAGENQWTPVPYEDDGAGGSKNDINDILSTLAEVDIDPATNPPQDYSFDNGKTKQVRKAFKPTVDVMVVAFGQTFDTGIHDAHMSQGERPRSRFARDNGVHQDGGLFFLVGSAVRAHFTVFSSQFLPTDNRGFPLPGAKAVCPRVDER